ncbi:hypothetical protein BDY19DRAFT_941157 [Irpex rosettiformis]|uniref:Uncharacterized protein n=1 Tax=Irpex rosettiformis TaxID=378272 RepID=A0ACB8U7C6_9APHY|nr:hypothetical protein BDY19DRAFT_941157 [Irpex rosettiformis]
MTRGNQRDTDRAKAQKKAQASAKGKVKESAASLQKRREQDAANLREKQKVKLPPDEFLYLSTWTADICCRKRKKRKRGEGQRNNTSLGRVPSWSPMSILFPSRFINYWVSTICFFPIP